MKADRERAEAIVDQVGSSSAQRIEQIYAALTAVRAEEREKLRDRFAGQALNGLLCALNRAAAGVDYESVSKWAYAMADALLVARGPVGKVANKLGSKGPRP